MPELSSEREHGVREALAEVFRDYGLAGLDSPAILDAALPALLPDQPDEVARLRTVAATLVAAKLVARITAGSSVDEAIREVASQVSGDSMDAATVNRIVTQYADVLGHPIAAETVVISAPPAQASHAPPAPTVAPLPVAAPGPAVAPPAPAVAAPAPADPVTVVVTPQPTPAPQAADVTQAAGAPRAADVTQAAAAPRAADVTQAAAPPQAAERKPPKYVTGKASPYIPRQYSDTELSQPDFSQPAYSGAPHAGRAYEPTREFIATAYVLPPPPPPRKPRNYLPIIVGLVVVAVVALGAVAIVLTSHPSCRGAACKAQSTPSARPSGRAAKPTSTLAGTPPVVASTLPPADGAPGGGAVPSGGAVPTGGPGAGPPVALASRMPADITVSSCLTTGNYGSFLNARTVATYYSCTEDASSDMPNMLVWGYQFTDRESYFAGVNDFNGFVNFNVSSASAACPPTGPDGYSAWWRGADSSATLGHVECYADQSGQPNYVWTDDLEFTIIVAAATTTQSFTDLDDWWHANNRSSNGI